MKFGVLVFPGSNCDHDVYHVLQKIAHQPVSFLWHESEDLENCDAIVVPGGFAYGDYLRTGAIARFSPVMQSIKTFAAKGGLVLGICNGFQILCEAGLLPGALLRNAGLKYICKQVHLRAETVDTPFTRNLQERQVLQLPIGHMEGNYFCSPATLAELRRQSRIVFRYVTPDGEMTPEANPNGSIDNIAGVLSEGGNVLGMMPHPDRSSEALLGSSDGLLLFESMIATLRATPASSLTGD
jgi:phosphoribosylformylglycinamidine synthase subunit PurQ / glutaminase